MNGLVILLFLFFIGSFVGWGIELLFRKWFGAHNPEHRWINPGFLTGPYLPLYGFGLITLYSLASIPVKGLDFAHTGGQIGTKLIMFAFMAGAMTVLEYIAGVIFIKWMHVQLWDYSKEWGNLQGIICPRFSFFWALLGAAYYFLVHPYILNSLNWLSRNLTFCLVIGFFYGVFAIDVTYSFQLVSKIRKFAIEKNIIVKYEELKSDIRRVSDEKKEKIRFMFAFRPEVPLREHLERYIEVIQAFAIPEHLTKHNRGKEHKNSKNKK
ncbi:MAG TPA: putative ABC transporter permease [Lachnospiraceae bacterium]|nr:putative ABC transporter permease [Lachnospiraceae bacterium]HPF29669.1 putative ABC transporter permease [Lachnospiraceae bacterium]